jgi:hypothetical protein
MLNLLVGATILAASVEPGDFPSDPGTMTLRLRRADGVSMLAKLYADEEGNPGGFLHLFPAPFAPGRGSDSRPAWERDQETVPGFRRS